MTIVIACHWDTAIFNHLYKFGIEKMVPESAGPPFEDF